MFWVILLFLLAASANADLIEECMNYTIYPLQYDLTIKPYIFSNGSSYYDCDITISVIANAPDIKIIELDAKDLLITDSSIKVLDGETDIVNGARPFVFDHRKEKIYIHLREPLKKYDAKNGFFVYKIQISFIKNLQRYEDLKSRPGIFLVQYFEPANPRAKYLYTTRFELNKAKSAFPCFENPRFEAGFKLKVHMVREKPDSQYPNTILTISEELKRESSKEYEVIQYMQSPQVALHQVGFHLSQFAHIEQSATHTNDTLYVWAISKDLRHYDFVLNYGVKIMDLIHEFSRTERPLLNGPINLVAVPAKLEGYETSSWNLLTNSAYKLANDRLTSIKQLERLKYELAQQLSRIWLGNPGETKVTRWREEWFKEGMATYLAYYLLAQYNYGAQTSTSTRPLDYYGLRMKLQAMSHDWHHSTPALINFKNTLAVEIPPRYKQLVATKTGAIWWMLENWLQTDQLHTSFVKHINKMRGQYISMWDLIAAIDNDTIKCTNQLLNGSTPSRILESWFHQRGYPLVTVNVLRDRRPNAIQLKQRHFSFSAEHRKPTNFLIPISYLIESNDNCFNCQPRFTFGQTSEYTFSENLNGGWIILNRNASGYYRVNYDTETWKLIAAALRKNPLSINELNRAQIVNDVFALYMSGDIDRLLAENILLYLDNERSLMVWEAVIDGFNMLRIKDSMTQITKNLYWEWEEFMGKRVMRIFKLPVVQKNEEFDSPQNRLFRSQIISFATEISHEPCLEYIRNCYQEYSSGRASLDPDIREAAFYVFENSSHSNMNHKPLIRYIEEEDRISAEHKVREKNGFLIYCPYGEPRPLPIISTEASTTSVSVTEKNQTVTSVSVPEKLEKPIESTSSSTTNSPILFATFLISLSLLLLE